VLTPVPGAAEIGKALRSRHHTFLTKIDASKYGISRVDFYFHISKAPWPTEVENVLAAYVKITSAAGESWWRVVEPASEDPHDVFLNIAKSDSPDPEPAMRVAPATGDRTIPVFDITWTSQEPNLWTIVREHHLMLDLRGETLRPVADLACDSITAFGACGVYEAQQMTSSTYDCDWSQERGDFVCQGRAWDDDGEKRTRFALISNKPIAFPPASASPATLEEFAERAERDPAWRGRQSDIPGLGKTTHLARFALPDKNVVHLFAAYPMLSGFAPRFLDVILKPGAAPEVGLVAPSALFEASDRDFSVFGNPDPPAKLTIKTNESWTGPELKFEVKPLWESPATHLVQVTARTDRMHSLFWLTVDETRPNQIVMSAALVATDGLVHTRCSEWRTVNSAASITRESTTGFHAVADVEPSHTTSQSVTGYAEPEPDQTDKECPYEVSVEWAGLKGWQLLDPKVACPTGFHPRQLTIADDGSLSTKPAEIQPK
jgi:hypothetical protein